MVITVRPGAVVEAATPAVLPAMSESSPRNRLGLAQWLVDRRNPLTARVTVNRIWQSIFGTGLVRTSEDFGSQGEYPSHPELLDWLAMELMDSGWDIQHLLKLILNSSTYRQTSHVTPDRLERDPENRLLSRGPRFDSSPSLCEIRHWVRSGLLNRKIGGPSVKPYHPPGLYEQVTAGVRPILMCRADRTSCFGDRCIRIGSGRYLILRCLSLMLRFERHVPFEGRERILPCRL